MTDGNDGGERLVSLDTTGVDHVTCIVDFYYIVVLSYLHPSPPLLSAARVDCDGRW